MATIVIDKRRTDSTYHYIYTNGSESRKGWGTYHMWKTAEEKSLWTSAVSKYCSENKIETPCAKIKKLIQQVRDAIDVSDKQFPDKVNPMMPALGAIISAAAGGDCDDTYLMELMRGTSTDLPTPKNVAKYAFNATLTNLEIEINKNLNGLTQLGVNAFVLPVLQMGETLVDTYFGTIDAIYDEYTRYYNEIFYYYKMFSDSKRKVSDEDKKKYKEKFKEALKQVGKEIAEQLFLMLSIEPFIELFKTLKNLWEVGKDVWKGIVAKFKALKNTEVDGESPLMKQFKQFIIALLPLIGGMIGALLAYKCTKDQDIDNAKRTLDENLKNLGIEGNGTDDPYSDFVDTDFDKTKKMLSSVGQIYSYAADQLNGYSLYQIFDDIKDSSVEYVSIEDCSCKVSMCENYIPSDIDFDYTPLHKASRVIVEFGKDNLHKLNVQVGQTIKIDETIGTIEDIAVKSKIECTVTEVANDYFIADYYVDEIFNNISNEESYINKVTKYLQDKQKQLDNSSSYTAMSDLMMDSFRVDTFIRDYISYFRFPELAAYTREHVKGNAEELSTEDFVKVYEETAEKIIDGYKEKVKESASKDKVMPLAEQGKLITIKKDLDSKKGEAFDEIIKLYKENPGNLKYCSKGRIIDFMLYTYYIEYLSGDRFEYDEDNPFIVKLADALNTFIGQRIRIELVTDNLESILENFNELCDNIIGRYWKFAGGETYYQKMSSLFKGDYYLDTVEVIESSVGQANTITVFKKVLAFLKNLVNYTEQETATIEYNDSTDIDKLLKTQSEIDAKTLINQDNITLERNLKKIAYKFISIRKIEMSMKDFKISTLTADSNIKKFELLKKKFSSKTFAEHKEGQRYKLLHKLRGQEKVLDEYIKALKKQTTQEAAVLKPIVQEALDWYETNHEGIDDGTIFNQYREIPWPAPSSVYKNNLEHDYYLFNNISGNLVPPKSFDELENLIDLKNEGSSDTTITFPIKATPEELMATASGKTAVDFTQMKYWLKYCSMATVVNCMLPMFWATGIIILGAPIPLPIIYIPCVVIPGRVTVVIGLGICGIAIMPMMLFANPSPLAGSLLIPINIMVDMLIKQLNAITNMQMSAIKVSLEPIAKALDEEIKSYYKELENVDFQIEEIKKLEIDYPTLKGLGKLNDEDTTSKKKEVIK